MSALLETCVFGYKLMALGCISTRSDLKLAHRMGL
jgi:hypothetical protein